MILQSSREGCKKVVLKEKPYTVDAEKASTRVIEDSELSEKFEENMEIHQTSVLSAFCSAAVVDVVTQLVRGCLLHALGYIGDLVLMSETMEGLRNKFRKWK